MSRTAIIKDNVRTVGVDLTPQALIEEFPPKAEISLDRGFQLNINGGGTGKKNTGITTAIDV